MTKEEIIKLLEEKGIPVGQWEQKQSKQVQSPLLEKQKQTLLKLQGLLETQLQSDIEKVTELKIALQKIKGRKDAE